MSHFILEKKFPPSLPCSCDICLSYRCRPGWWSIEQATKAIETGFAPRMMLEISPELSFGELSPAFKGNEADIAVQAFTHQGCTFLKDNLCTLFGTGLHPLECRFCHHSRIVSGSNCHAPLEKDWNSNERQRLVIRWSKITQVSERHGLIINSIKG